MLISFKVKNFLSIENEIFIDFRASGSRQLPKNLQKYKMSYILKSIGIYGANASGKSNIIRAFHFVWELTKFYHSYNLDSKIRPTQFKLSTKRVDEPSKFELTFTKKGYTYEYGFSCLNSKIVDEYLYRWDDSYKKQSEGDEIVVQLRKHLSNYKKADPKELGNNPRRWMRSLTF